MKTRILTPILTLLALSSLANAATTIYTTQASFLAALSAVSSIETFDSLPASGVSLAPVAFTPAGFSFTATPAGIPVLFNYLQGGGDRWLSTNRDGDAITFSFTGGGPYAVGGFFFSTDASGVANGASVTATTNDGSTQASGASTPLSFIGFISDAPITSLTLASTSGALTDFPTANNVTIAIPEPSSLGLVAVAALAGVMTRRRKTIAA